MDTSMNPTNLKNAFYLITTAWSYIWALGLIGLSVVLLFRDEYNRRHIPIALAAIMIINMLLVPLVNLPVSDWRYKSAETSRLTVNQLFHGRIVDAWVVRVPTGFNSGNFEAGYRCDPDKCFCDSNGKNCSTCWDKCPYCSFEEQYYIRVWWGNKSDGSPRLEDINLWGNQLPEDVEEYRWRDSDLFVNETGEHNEYGNPVPEYLKIQVGVGAPADWVEIVNLLREGIYPPFSKVTQFENPLLASDSELWKTQSSFVAEFKSRSLIPDIRREPDTRGRVNLVYAVGAWNAQDFAFFNGQFNAGLDNANASFGAYSQGDLRILFVNDADARLRWGQYLDALTADWGNPDTHGDWIVPKNSLVLVFFTDQADNTGTAKAFTGIHGGNIEFLDAINKYGVLDNLPTDPTALFGRIKDTLTLNQGEPQPADNRGYTAAPDPRFQTVAEELVSGGQLRQFLYGQSDITITLPSGEVKPVPMFVRFSMSDNYPEYWKEIKPTVQALQWETKIVVVINVVLTIIIYVALVVGISYLKRS